MIDGGVTAAAGFLAGAAACGIKNGGKKKDLAVIYSEVPAISAGVFTCNKVKAAPLLLTQKHLQAGYLRAVVVNSGNANACTGEQGMLDALKMAELTAGLLKIRTEEVAVSSTGVIGVKMPMERVEKGIMAACAGLKREGSGEAAEAIMTTDLVPKSIAYSFKLGNKEVRIGGIAKGSGMIHPNMATMLGFITTDALISREALQQALKEVTDQTFNMITVDGDQSTNDMVLVMANGLAGNPRIEIGNEYYGDFIFVLRQVCEYLAKEIARDGEGATKLLEVEVKGAASLADARQIARTVAKSNLVKTAIFGEDANWGRILAAVGYSGADCDPDLVDIALGPVQVAAGGKAIPFSEEEAKAVLQKDSVKITIDLHLGYYSATAWGCDLSFDYIKINSSYRS
ncbi:MAG TPA: bifunctional glutamate N-acetyltransferase/amino-acid acetyltransferase ArgJ [Clostridia bacterium]|nr:bifunctional glutamate N-acetyltransferase/amino-acid acetyltransferase ArgJ [Clostridia bacterium]